MDFIWNESLPSTIIRFLYVVIFKTYDLKIIINLGCGLYYGVGYTPDFKT